MLTLAFSSRPQQSTGVAPLEFVTPERVWSLSVERMVGSPTPEETDGSPRAIREVIRARLRNLIHKVRRSLTLAQRRYKGNYAARVRPVNKHVQAGDWVFVDGNARTKYKLGTRAAGPYKVSSRGERKFSLDIGGYPETVSSDHVTAAPGPPGDPQTLLQNLGVPRCCGPRETPEHGQGVRLGGLRRARGRGRRHATFVDPLVGLSPRGGHPRFGRRVRASKGPPVRAACRPTSRGSGVRRTRSAEAVVVVAKGDKRGAGRE